MKDSIALIGFMATGKTTIGKALKNILGSNYEFIETDQLIVNMTGKSIPNIFSEEGEQKFRNYEIDVCERVSNLNKVIISCGGGVVLNERNVENLKKNCYIVLLKTKVEEIYRRIKKDGKETRPLINRDDPFNEIKLNLQHRENLYKNAADLIIDTTNREIDDIVSEILGQIKLYKE